MPVNNALYLSIFSTLTSRKAYSNMVMLEDIKAKTSASSSVRNPPTDILCLRVG